MRAISTIAVAATMTASLTGCTLLTLQATQLKYDAADGVSVQLEGMKIEGVLIVANADNTVGNLVFVAQNTTNEDQRLTVQWPTATGDRMSEVQTIPAGQTARFGFAGYPQVLIEGAELVPGATLDIYFQAGTTPGKIAAAQVFDTTWAQYENLAPADPVEIADDDTQG